MRDRIQNSCCVVVLALLCFAPNALAQSLQTNNSPSSNALNSVYVGTVSSMNLATVSLLFDHHDKDCKYDKRDCKKNVNMPEGGSPAAYFLLAGLVCFGAIIFRYRRQPRPQGSV